MKFDLRQKYNVLGVFPHSYITAKQDISTAILLRFLIDTCCILLSIYSALYAMCFLYRYVS